MSDQPWSKPLDVLRSTTAELDANLNSVPAHELGDIAAVLRGVNRQIWKMIDTLEAGRVKYLYDVAALVRATADDRLDPVDNWLELVENDVFKINHKELLRLAGKRGIDVAEYLEVPDDDD